MKLKLLSLAIIGLMLSCSEPAAENTETTTPTVSEETIEEPQLDLVSSIVTKGGAKAADQVEIESMMLNLGQELTENTWEAKAVGHWVGMFGKNKINISITKIDGEKAEGFSVCAGNFRKIVGTVTKKDNDNFAFKLDEPGTDKYDGSFEFVINITKHTLSGSWTPFKKEGNSAKTYSLVKKTYNYNAGLGEYPKTSTSNLDLSDVENANSEDLAYMRNEIYARHGYSFKNKEFRTIFDAKDWYIPMGVDIRHKLTEIEIKNIGLIYEYENYFEENYDDYGR